MATGTRRRRKRGSGLKKAKSRTASASNSKRPDGSISSCIYDAVEKLVAGGNMTRTAAFRQLSKQTGRKEGTVAVNYYYAAKKRGATRRKPGRPKAVKGVRRTGSPSRIESVLASLTALIRAQESELSALRREGARFAELRRLIGA